MTRTDTPPTTATKKRILVLDDNPGICALLSAWLSNEGYVVKTASAGREFLTACAGDVPDVVITDILMPDGDGFEVIEAAKAGRRRSKVIAMSGGGEYLPGHEYIKLARSIGADEVLLKPFTQPQLISALERVMN